MSASLRFALGVALALCGCAAASEIVVIDDRGQSITLKQPARRIVSTAPHVTELLFAAGAGDRIVGVVEYSDYPEAANSIPRIGSNMQLDLERIVSLKPDLIVAWLHGSAQRQLDKLFQLGIPVFYSEPRRLGDIERSIRQFGRFAGTEGEAGQAAAAFASREAGLRRRYAGRPAVSVFYQIYERPLMTISGNHVITDVIRMCGGENVFAGLKPVAPAISTEAVLAADPEVIFTSVFDKKATDGLEGWKKWPRLTANARGNFFTIPSDLINRHTPRILEGAQRMCAAFEAARERRPK